MTLLQSVYEAIDNKRGEDIIVLNMEGISPLADQFIITHANSERQVQAIAREVSDAASKLDHHAKRLEGLDGGRWVLIDLGDIVVHVFHRDERAHYNLEKLWRDAPLMEVEMSQ